MLKYCDHNNFSQQNGTTLVSFRQLEKCEAKLDDELVERKEK